MAPEAVEHIIVETPAEAPASQTEVIEAVAEADVAVIEARSEAAVAEIEAAGEVAVAVAEVVEAQRDEQWQSVRAEMGALSERMTALELTAAETLALALSIQQRLPPLPNPPEPETTPVVVVEPVEPAALTASAAARPKTRRRQRRPAVPVTCGARRVCPVIRVAALDDRPRNQHSRNPASRKRRRGDRR
jgi:hypothetical protein